MFTSLCILLGMVVAAFLIGRLKKSANVFANLFLAITLGFGIGTFVTSAEAENASEKSVVVTTAASPMLHTLSSAVVLTEEQTIGETGQDITVGDTVVTETGFPLTRPTNSEIEDDS